MKAFIARNINIIFLLALALITAWTLFVPGYFSHHDDLQVIRIFEMRKCFADLQIPCRWAPDLGYGYGLPVFNYYSVFPYYVGAIASFVLGFIGAAKFLFLLPVLFAPAGMYLVVKELFGRWPALTSGVLYTLVPYRALNIYVRGALAESIALAIVPFIFYFAYRLAKQTSLKNFLGLTLSLVILLTTHNISSMLFIPLILIWAFYWLFTTRFKTLKIVMFAFIFAFGLSAFFLVPAYLEKDLVQTESLISTDLDYHNHFVAVRQLFLDNDWGYGASVAGTSDGLSFQIGILHWLIAFSAVVVIIINRKKLPKNLITPVAIFVGVFFAAMFMTHGKSHFVWENFSLLPYVQFPWRFLGLIAICTSVLGGVLVYLLDDGLKKSVAVIILVLGVALTFSFFKPQTTHYGLTDEQKLSGSLFAEQQKGALLDYLPKTAVDPKRFAPNVPVVIEGKATISKFVKTSDSWEMQVSAETPAKIEIPVFMFAGWDVPGYSFYANQYGRLEVQGITPGQNLVVQGYFRNTPTRKVANLISLFSLLFLVLGIKYAGSRKILN